MTNGPFWIGLYGDHTCEPLNLQPRDVNIGEIARTLANLCRFGGRARPFLSVAEHSVSVALAVEAVAPRYALAALLHDAAEAFIGDMVTPLKRRLSMDDVPINVIEEEILEQIFSRLGIEWPDGPGWTTIREADHKCFLKECSGYLGRPFWTAVPGGDHLSHPPASFQIRLIGCSWTHIRGSVGDRHSH